MILQEKAEPDSEPEITVKLLAEGKKTIPIYYQYGETWNTNIKLPVFVITNKGDIPVVINGIDVVGKATSKEVCRNIHPSAFPIDGWRGLCVS
ncbi:MAG: hypothetical protein WBE11_10740 [Candidatus Aminicenantaceae bacterium]